MRKLMILVMGFSFFLGSCQDKESKLYPPPTANDTIYVATDPIIITDTIYTPSDPIIIRDTVIEFEKPKVVYKDSVIDVRWLATGQDTLNKWVIYGVTQYGNALRISIADTLGFHSSKIQGGEKIRMSLKFKQHVYKDSSYTLQHGTSLNRIPFRKLDYKIRTMDNTGAYTQTYFNKDWEFSSREADSPELMAQTQFSDFEGQAGNPFPNSWRHSSRFTKKYWQIRARDKETGEIFVLPLTGNVYITP